MPWKEQPASLAYAPPAYPGHSYAGTGEIVTLRLGDEIVGWLTRKSWSQVGFLPRAGMSDDAHMVRRMVQDDLAQFASDGKPIVEAWAEILNHVTHDAPRFGALHGLVKLAAG